MTASGDMFRVILTRRVVIGMLVIAPSVALAAGSQSYTTPGTYTFTVPSYGTLSVQISAAGGGGGGFEGNGAAGGNSAFGGNYATGGGGGFGGQWCQSASNGSPGIGVNGSYNVTGGGAPGGAGGVSGPAYYYCQNGGPYIYGGNGGAGGYASITYNNVAPWPGEQVTVVVGQGGSGGIGGTVRGWGGPSQAGAPGNPGADGSVSISWTDADPCPTPIESYWGSGTYLLWSSATRRVNAASLNFCVRNNSPLHYFVPGRTNAELQSFLNAAGRLNVSVF